MKILFVCRSNVGRSQMAEGLVKKNYPKIEVLSAGTNVGTNDWEGKTLASFGNTAENVVESLKEEGIDVSDWKLTQLTEELVDSADKVIIMAERKNWPDYLLDNSKVVFWNIGDPKGRDLKYHKKIKNLIKEKIEKLLE